MSFESRHMHYGYRARIGYTSPLAATEVFPYEFYAVAPKGVTLVITTLTVIDATSAEVSDSYELSLRAAKDMGRIGVDLITLGGIPINMRHGLDKVDALIADTAKATGVRVSTSLTAQMEALRASGGRCIAIGHPQWTELDPMYSSIMKFYNLPLVGILGAHMPPIDLGKIPLETSMELCRNLKKLYPDADTIWLPCPHWAISEAVEAIERELGITVITANQAITWQAMRLCGIKEQVGGYGRLLRDF